MRFVAVNSKYSLVSHIFELGIPKSFPFSKETLAKAKMLDAARNNTGPDWGELRNLCVVFESVEIFGPKVGKVGYF